MQSNVGKARKTLFCRALLSYTFTPRLIRLFLKKPKPKVAKLVLVLRWF